METQIKFILQTRKGTNRYFERPTWLINKVMEAITGKKDSFEG